MTATVQGREPLTPTVKQTINVEYVAGVAVRKRKFKGTRTERSDGFNNRIVKSMMSKINGRWLCEHCQTIREEAHVK